MADKFFIVSELNGFVLDVEHGSIADGARLINFPHNGAANQQFMFNCNGDIESVKSGKKLSVDCGACKGNKIIQSSNCNAPSQQWRIHKDGSIRIVGSNLCLDVYKNDKNSGVGIIAWPHHGGANQRWRLVNSFK